jgi:hypothetical protein
MAVFDNTGSSLSATSLEGALLEVATSNVAIGQAGDAATGFTGTLTFSAAQSAASFNFSIPVSESSDASQIQLQAVAPAVADYDITPPTDGSFLATSPHQALLELGKKLNLLEKQQGTTPNRVQLGFNLDTGLASLSLNMPAEIIDSPDGFAIQASEFLA